MDWRSVYRRHVALERAWFVADAPEPVARQFFRGIVHGHRDLDTILREFRSFRLEPPEAELLDEAYFLQRAIYPSDRDRPGGRHPDDPLEDAYAAALSMLPHGFWVESPNREQVYRGQRNAKLWRVIPLLFRNPQPQDGLTKLGEAVSRIRAAIPGLDEEQAIAVAQHYSKELDVATWLLDVTYDPRVALFFATDSGVEGDIGAVHCIVKKEWERLSAGGTNRLGRLHVIDVPGILRIERQRASFLDTSHPDLFDQYVAHTVWFRQVNGLRFEDMESGHPVSAEHLYPSADPVLDRLQRVPPSATAALTLGPAGDAREPLGSSAYLGIAQSWCQQANVEIDAYHEDTLLVICDVHARLQQVRVNFELPDRSLARLKDAVDLIIDAQQRGVFITPRDAMRWSLSRLPPGARAGLDTIIDDCARERNLC